MKLRTCFPPMNLRKDSLLPLLLRRRGPGRGGPQFPVFKWFSSTLIFFVLLLLAGKIHGAAGPKPVAGSTNRGQLAKEFQPLPTQAFGWRGDGSGRFPSTRPVTKWSTKENVRWQTEV